LTIEDVKAVSEEKNKFNEEMRLERERELTLASLEWERRNSLYVSNLLARPMMRGSNERGERDVD
jgi:hypothetical protein